MRDEHKAREIRQVQLEAHQRRDEDKLMDFWEDGVKGELPVQDKLTNRTKKGSGNNAWSRRVR
jgi:hypothetical protein